MAWYKAAEGNICPGSTLKVILGFLCGRCKFVMMSGTVRAANGATLTCLPFIEVPLPPS